MGTGDDMEANASTFYKEMREVAYILETVAPGPASASVEAECDAAAGELAAASADSVASAPRVLVLLDELGRG